MRFFKREVVMQEVPGEISLCYFICGCPLHCQGCHSSFTWNEKTGFVLDKNEYANQIDRYKGYISCVLFMGGEWHEDELEEMLRIAKQKGLKTALYTGLETVSESIKRQLNYLKTGPWIERLGGLTSAVTNQQLVNLETGEVMNRIFRREILAS